MWRRQHRQFKESPPAHGPVVACHGNDFEASQLEDIAHASPQPALPADSMLSVHVCSTSLWNTVGLSCIASPDMSSWADVWKAGWRAHPSCELIRGPAAASCRQPHLQVLVQRELDRHVRDAQHRRRQPTATHSSTAYEQAGAQCTAPVEELKKISGNEHACAYLERETSRKSSVSMPDCLPWLVKPMAQPHSSP